MQWFRHHGFTLTPFGSFASLKVSCQFGNTFDLADEFLLLSKLPKSYIFLASGSSRERPCKYRPHHVIVELLYKAKS